MVIKKSDAKPPVLARETVPAPGVGGDVVVQAMMMSDRLQIATADLPQYAHIAEVLARSVVDADGERIWTAKEWEVFGGTNQEEVWKLFDVAKRLSKLDGDKPSEEKKPAAPK